MVETGRGSCWMDTPIIIIIIIIIIFFFQTQFLKPIFMLSVGSLLLLLVLQAKQVSL
jgi:hypothetical protein